MAERRAAAKDTRELPRVRRAIMIRTDAAHPTATNPDAEATFAAALPWVRAEAERLARRLPPSVEFDADDLFQVGCIAAWKLAREWDAARSLFTTFAKLRVHGAMIDHVRDAASCGFSQAGSRLKLERGEPIRVRSLATPMPSGFGDEGRRATVGDMLGDCDAEVGDGIDAEFASLLKRVGVDSTARERGAAVGYYAAGKLMKEVAGELGVCESRASQIVSGLVERVRDQLVAQGRNRFTAFA